MKRNLIITLLAVLAVAMGGAAAVQAHKGDDHAKTAICHRTASDTNPYVYEVVDNASLPAHFNNLPGHPAKFWKSDGTFRGVAHVAGDPKNDYLATSEASCQDLSPTPSPTSSPESSATPSPSATPTIAPSSEPSTPPCDECGGPGSEVPSLPNTATMGAASTTPSAPVWPALLLGAIAVSIFLLTPRRSR